MNSPVDQFLTTFKRGVYALRADMVQVSIVLAFAGLVIHVVSALQRNDMSNMFMVLVRLAIVSLTVALLPEWCDQIAIACGAVNKDMGATDLSGLYQQAIVAKFGPSSGSEVNPVTGVLQFMANPTGTLLDEIMRAFTLALSWAAQGIQQIVLIAQVILYWIQVAISPAFIASAMIPALSFLSRRFFMVTISIILYPLSWTICGLITKVLLDLAINPSKNQNLGFITDVATATGPLAGICFMLITAVWVLGSTLAGPLVIHSLFAASGPAVGMLFGGIGRSTTSYASSMARSASHSAGGTSLVQTPISAQSGSMMASGVRQNFAKRPRDPHPESEPPPFRHMPTIQMPDSKDAPRITRAIDHRRSRTYQVHPESEV